MGAWASHMQWLLLPDKARGGGTGDEEGDVMPSTLMLVVGYSDGSCSMFHQSTDALGTHVSSPAQKKTTKNVVKTSDFSQNVLFHQLTRVIHLYF